MVPHFVYCSSICAVYAAELNNAIRRSRRSLVSADWIIFFFPPFLFFLTILFLSHPHFFLFFMIIKMDPTLGLGSIKQ